MELFLDPACVHSEKFTLTKTYHWKNWFPKARFGFPLGYQSGLLWGVRRVWSFWNGAGGWRKLAFKTTQKFNTWDRAWSILPLLCLIPTIRAFAPVKGNPTLEKRPRTFIGGTQGTVYGGSEPARRRQTLASHSAEPPGHTVRWKVSVSLWRIHKITTWGISICILKMNIKFL